MAVTLPYEDMEFVPLDILTAQEQNQLVANIEYLAGLFPLGSPEIAENAILNTKINNGAVTEFKIADGAVTPAKINFSEFADVVVANTGSITLGAGKWLIALVRKVNQTNASQTAVLLYTVPGTTISDTFACPPAPSGGGQNVFVNMVDFAVVDISSSTTFSISNTTQTNVTVSSRWFALPLKH